MIHQNKSLRLYIICLCNQYKVYIFSLFIIAWVASVFNISVNYQIKEIIDAIASDQDTALGMLIGLFAFYKLMHHGMFFMYRLLEIRYKPMILEQTITDLYKKTEGHSLHWFDSHLSGEISSKIIDFQSGIDQLITVIFHALNNIVTVIISLLFLTRINTQPVVVLSVFILIYSPIILLLLQKKMRLQGQYVESRQKTTGIINDNMSNIFGIKIIGNSEREFQFNLLPALLKWKLWDRKTRIFDAWWVDNADTIMTSAMSAIQIYLLAYLYRDGYITSGGFTFAAMTTLNIHAYLDRLMDSLLFSIIPLMAQVSSSYKLINEAYDVMDKTDAKKLDHIKGDIKYKGVGFAYGERDELILKNFDLHIKPGEKVGIVGMSGAGKTTMIKCLLRYFDVQSGEISIDGHHIDDITQESLRENISIIPQDITMFHRTIRENLLLAKYNATDDELISACRKAKIHDDIMKMEHGYDSVVGERGVKVSGGQRQRIAIARAILKNSQILILDEATSSLDTPTEILIQASIDQVLKESNATVIAIAHRLSTLKHMDRIIVLEKGKIVEEGRHAALICKDDGVYRKLWDMQII